MQICTIFTHHVSLFFGLLTVTDPDLELGGWVVGEGGVLLVLVAFNPEFVISSFISKIRGQPHEICHRLPPPWSLTLL